MSSPFFSYFWATQKTKLMAKKKKIIVYRTNLVNVGIGQGQMVMPAYLYSETEFDREGRTVSQASFSSEGILQEKIAREFDVEGRVIKEFYFAEEDEPSETVAFERDGSGRLLREIRTYIDGSVDTTTCQYDQEERLVEKVTVDDEGVTDKQEKFIWKEKQLVAHEVIDSGGDITEKDEYGYNDRGLVSEHRRVSTETGENFRLVIRYDKEGRKTSDALYDADDDLMEMTRYEYDDAGVLLASSVESPGNKRVTRFLYDEKGNPLGQEENDEAGNRVVWVENSYDDQGNIEGSVVFINGRGVSMSQHYELRYDYEWFNE